MDIILSHPQFNALVEYLNNSIFNDTNINTSGVININTFDRPVFFVNTIFSVNFDVQEVNKSKNWILGFFFVEQLTSSHLKMLHHTLTAVEDMISSIYKTYGVKTKVIIISNFEEIINKFKRKEFATKLNIYPFFMPYQIHNNEFKKLKSLTSTKEYDIAFVGCINERRNTCIQKIKDLGLSINVINNLYGEERDKEILKCNILMCVHYYEDGLFYENIRLDRFLFQDMTIVCETSSDSELLDIKDYVYFADLDNIPSMCKHALTNPILIQENKKKEIIEKRKGYQTTLKDLLETLQNEQ